MPRSEPLEPDVAAALEAIDATLHGEPVDPDLADLAELSLLLRESAPEADEAFLGRLDRRVAERFQAPDAVKRAARRSRRGRGSRRGLWTAGTVLAGVAALAVGIAVVPHGGSSSSSSSGGTAASGIVHSKASSSGAAASSAGASGSSPGVRLPTPASAPHRQVVQTARLSLRAAPGRVDTVAAQVFDVIGAEQGYVTSSHVSSQARGPGAATFSLRVPTARLQQTLDRLSHLHRARVTSREDSSADVTGQIRDYGSRLDQARALRRSLLHQLAAADTTHEVDHLQAELRRNETTTVSDENAIAHLRGRVSDSSIAVDVSGPPAPVHHDHRSSGGFTIGGAWHDAGHILLVAAGVALIGLAVLVPVALLAAVAAWAWALMLRRRRETALGP